MVMEPMFDLSAAKMEIEAQNQKFMDFFSASDSAGLAGLYAQDAKFMMEGAPAISGRMNIQSTFSGLMQSDITKVELKLVDLWGTEDLLVEEGEYTLHVGDTEADHGKYLVLWQKEDGEWKLFRDISNSNLSPEE
ncbi:hypothetical protein GCM10028791_04850 [Echinicola sediminis]